jgi:lipopolysaccharide/colanic/teichoic acid biosynthesis glycosyltransferase
VTEFRARPDAEEDPPAAGEHRPARQSTNGSGAEAYPGLPRNIEAGPDHPAKRWMDVIFGSIFIGILWPIWILAAALIWRDSHGPIMIRQKRVGLNGAEFDFYKFRTMHHRPRKDDIHERIPQGDLTKQLLSPKGKPRNATSVGWVLRKTTIDELPQLFNVVKGDMSLVGPRPDMPIIVEHWPEEFRQRHLVKPGLTGLAVINGRSDLTHYEKVRWDLEYVKDHPISRDLMILFRTIALVASKKGAR